MWVVPEDRTVLTKSATQGLWTASNPRFSSFSSGRDHVLCSLDFHSREGRQSVREEGYLPAACWRHPLRPRLFRPAGLTAATFTCLLGHRKLFTLQHLNKAGRLWKDSRKAFQVWLEEHCGGGADRFQEPGVENSWISRLAGALCSQTQSRCGSLPKTCMRSSQAAFSPGWGRGSWVPPPHLRNYWELMEAGKRQSSFVSPALVGGSTPIHIWAALMRDTLSQLKQ